MSKSTRKDSPFYGLTKTKLVGNPCYAITVTVTDCKICGKPPTVIKNNFGWHQVFCDHCRISTAPIMGTLWVEPYKKAVEHWDEGKTYNMDEFDDYTLIDKDKSMWEINKSTKEVDK